MIGPMLHFGLGKHKHWTFSIEGSYWDSPFVGVDLGLEFGKNKFIAYSELQGGIAVAGVSAGPYVDLRRSGRKIGWQYTIWANYFLGADYRWRSHPIENESYLGVYFKFPANSSADDGSDPNGRRDFEDIFDD